MTIHKRVNPEINRCLCHRGEKRWNEEGVTRQRAIEMNEVKEPCYRKALKMRDRTLPFCCYFVDDDS